MRHLLTIYTYHGTYNHFVAWASIIPIWHYCAVSTLYTCGMMVFEEKTIPFRGTWLFKQISKVQFINLKPNSNNTYGYWNTFAKHFNRLLAFFGLLMRRSVHSANPRVVFLRCPTLTAPTHTMIVHPRTTSPHRPNTLSSSSWYALRLVWPSNSNPTSIASSDWMDFFFEHEWVRSMRAGAGWPCYKDLPWAG